MERMQNSILNFLFFGGVLLSLIYFIYREPFIVIIFSGVGYIMICYYIFLNLKKYIYLIIFFALFLMFYFLKLLFFQSVFNMGEFILFISHFGYSMYLIEQRDSLKILKRLYYILSIYLISIYFMEGTLNDISIVSSANMVNYIFLGFTILYLGLHYNKNNKVIVHPTLLNLLISFLSLGRSGMIVSIILLLSIVLLKYKDKYSKSALGIILILSPVVIFYIFNFVVDLIFDLLTKFGTRTTFFEDSPRDKMWTDYLMRLDIEKIIFGYDDKTHSFAGYTNIHNSFLDFHYIFGVGGVFFLLIITFFLFYFLTNKQYLYFILIICLLFRGMTDTVMLVWMYDYILIFMILVGYEMLYQKRRIKVLNTVSKFY